MFKTNFAGLTVLDPGDSLALDGYSFQSVNPLIIDRIMKLGARTHRHDEHPPIPNPIDGPVLDLTTNGNLPNDSDIAVGYTLIDTDGGETMISPVTVISTAPALDPPDAAPLYDVEPTGGHMLAGTYVYAVSLTDPNGETPAGASFFVDVPAGTDTNAVTISGLSDLVNTTPGATGWRLYKSTAVGTLHFLAAGSASLDDVWDDGLLCADCNVTPPTQNTTSVSQGIQVTVPDTVTNQTTGIVAYRIYMSVGGTFLSPSYVEERNDFGTLIEYTHVVVNPGMPPDVNTSYGGAQKINPDTELLDWHWKRPVTDATALPEPADEGDVRITQDDGNFHVFINGAWQLFTAPQAFWREPVGDVSALPAAGNEDGDVRLTVLTRRLYFWFTDRWYDLSAPPHGIFGPGGAPMPQRGGLQFENVTMLDDEPNDRTVVTALGGGDGEGGGGELLLDDKIEWKDELGAVVGSIWTQRFSEYVEVINDTFDGPIGTWGSVRVETDTGAMVSKSDAPLNVDDFPQNGWGTYRDMAVGGRFTLVNDNWNTLGLGILLNGRGIELVLRNDIHLVYGRHRPTAGQSWIDTSATVDITSLINVGDQVDMRVERENGTLYLYAYNVTTDTEIYAVSTAVPPVMMAVEGMTGVHTNVAANDSWRLEEINGNIVAPVYEMRVKVGDQERVVQDSKSDAPQSFGLPAPGWGGFSYTHLDGVWRFYGEAGKYEGTAPVPGELMLSIDPTVGWGYNSYYSVMTQDYDGSELGVVHFDATDNTVRWVSGRSTDPVTKYPLVNMSTISVNG